MDFKFFAIWKNINKFKNIMNNIWIKYILFVNIKEIKYEIKKEAITNFQPTLTERAKNFSKKFFQFTPPLTVYRYKRPIIVIINVEIELNVDNFVISFSFKEIRVNCNQSKLIMIKKCKKLIFCGISLFLSFCTINEVSKKYRQLIFITINPLFLNNNLLLVETQNLLS